ncbi:ComEC/Rec2 family competence protein [Mangrovicella endophytica]|uniref:ComEC/Rec2 family competence protein n=1 Tax=Mangrovicella endophytica TaxID=2066697 RepID=UPI000C9EC154|nr:ComEC/Rec2 family competence protein [Mangrovicella endophytica]
MSGAGAIVYGHRSQRRSRLLARLRRLDRATLEEWWAEQLATEAAARSGFFLIPGGLLLGAVLVYGCGFEPPPILGILTAGLFGAAAIALRHSAARAVLILVGCAALGVLSAQLELARTATTIISGDVTARLTGRVLWRDSDERGRIRYRLRVLATERPALKRPPQEVQITVSSRHAPVAVGELYRGLMRLGPPSGPAYPGAYDFAFAAYFDGLGARGFGLGPPDVAAATADERSDVSWLDEQRFRLTRLRLTISDRIRSVIGGGEGGVASALITGERSGIPDDVTEWLRSTGLSHVLSISGLHMAIVAGFAMLVLRGMLAAIPGAATRFPVKKIAAVGALVVATFYLLLAGDEVALLRSYIMLAIMLVAVLFDRPAITLRNVGIAAILILVTTPHAALTASFQMSFSATAALVGVFRLIADHWNKGEADASRYRSRLRTALIFFAGLAASSLIAGLATAPYAAFHFQRIAPFGLIANLLALPLFSFWIMPLALIAMVAMPLGLDWLPLTLMGYGLRAVFAIARAIHETMPDAPTGRMSVAALLLLSLALVLLAFLASRLRWIALPIAALGLLLAPAGPPPELLLFEDGNEIALIDANGQMIHRKDRPSRFVSEQWERAFAPSIEPASAPAASTRTDEPGADAEEASVRVAAAAVLAEHPPARAIRDTRKPSAFRCVDAVCRATTRGGLRITWTDDYEKTDAACQDADIAIVARAIRQRRCPTSARLVTLRTLRRSGSLAISATKDSRRPNVSVSIQAPPSAWNRHRLAAWPRSWRREQGLPAGQTNPSLPRGVKPSLQHMPRTSTGGTVIGRTNEATTRPQRDGAEAMPAGPAGRAVTTEATPVSPTQQGAVTPDTSEAPEDQDLDAADALDLR